jgi:hypothetical protein
MKKGILALAVVSAVLAVPVTASGDAFRAAQGRDDFRISFTLKSRGGEPVALKRFKFTRLDTPCPSGTIVQARGRIPFIKVNDRNRFSDSLNRARRKVRVKGKVSGDLNTVRGTIRAQGFFGPGASNCDSGRVRWVAR